jgi:ribonuclease P protein component
MGHYRTYPKTVRIRRRREFLALQRDGRRRHTSHFVVIRRTSTGAASRLGVTVSARIGNSVVRNRVKRLVREVFRHRRGDIVPSSDVLVIAKPGASTLTYAQAATELERVLEIVSDR